jgi:polyisoprenoid-binding protein YceI
MIMKSLTLAILLMVSLAASVRNSNLVQREASSEIDTQQSIIRWKGTKMLYTRSHEGTIRFKSGELSLNGNDITGGRLVVDMTTIEITDIPPHEPVPRNNLKAHLESDFETARFSTASLSIKKATTDMLCADLTIKGITREVCFRPVQTNTKSWNTNLIIRRSDFAIGEQGSWLEKRLVDQEIELLVDLRIK